jgi:hypothetical protein
VHVDAEFVDDEVVDNEVVDDEPSNEDSGIVDVDDVIDKRFEDEDGIVDSIVKLLSDVDAIAKSLENGSADVVVTREDTFALVK